MAVIKHVHAQSDAGVAGKPILEDLDAKLQEMVSTAQRTAESIIEAAKVESAKLESAAKRSGSCRGA